jgi:hypothetical protein
MISDGIHRARHNCLDRTKLDRPLYVVTLRVRRRAVCALTNPQAIIQNPNWNQDWKLGQEKHAERVSVPTGSLTYIANASALRATAHRLGETIHAK